MKAIADVSKMASNGQQMQIEHNGVEVSFTLSMFKRDNFTLENEAFLHINHYWETRPVEEQNRIFAIYASIAEDFDSLMSKNALKDSLTQKVTELMNIHALENMEHWVRYNSDIIIPSTFDEKYNENIDKNTSEDKTYTRSDYIKLVSLSLCLRAMVPIWGSYIKTIRGDAGNQFKELQAFMLLKNSDINRSDPMIKLYNYIDAQIGKDNFNATNTLNFICREDFPHWLLSLVCVKRLCIGDVRSKDPRANLITLIYNFIIQRIRSTDNDFTNMVKSKTADDFGPDGENKISNLERFKVTTNISLGQIVEMEYSMKDIYKVAHRLCVNVNPEILERSLKSSRELAQRRLLNPQMTLLRWVFSPAIMPRGLMYLPLDRTIAALGALEAILWSNGHKYLAILSTSHALLDDDVHRVSQVASKMRTPEDLTTELRKYFPFTQTYRGMGGSETEVYLVEESINTLANDLAKFTWRATADESMIEEVFGERHTRRIPILPDIKTQLTKLVIELGKTPKA